MWQSFVAPENTPFAVSLVVMVLLGLLEGLATLFGAGVSQVLDSLLPDADLNPHTEVGLEGDGGLTRLLGWLRVGQVPILMLLVVFLTSFGLLGFGLQSVSRSLLGSYLPGWLASIPVFLLSLPMVRLLGGGLNAIMPKDETTAVAADSLIGRVAHITLGRATSGSPAEAKVRDSFGQTHYLLVEPSDAEESFEQGSAVVLVERISGVYRAVTSTNPHLTD